MSLIPFRLILAAAVALGCAARTLPERTPVKTSPIAMRSGEWRVTDEVFVVTDASGTMYVEETFPEAKALSRGFIGAMPEASAPASHPDHYRAAVIGFGGDERVASPLAGFDRARLDSTAQQVHLMGDIHGFGGTTPLDVVLWQIQRMLQGGSGRAAVVVFSDGLPDRPDATLAAARRLAASRAEGVCFHAVQTGDDPAGTAFLTELSRVSKCGSVSSAANVGSAAGLDQLARAVFAGPAPERPVAAAGRVSACEGLVRLPIEFATDRWEVPAGAHPMLDKAAGELRGCPSLRVAVDGYTDSVGAAEYNQGLSQRRADAVREYLVTAGVDRKRFATHGFGESDPVASNDTAEGRARNRRVELVPSP